MLSFCHKDVNALHCLPYAVSACQSFRPTCLGFGEFLRLSRQPFGRRRAMVVILWPTRSSLGTGSGPGFHVTRRGAEWLGRVQKGAIKFRRVGADGAVIRVRRSEAYRRLATGHFQGAAGSNAIG